MKHFIFLLFLPVFIQGQDTLWDSFSDGNFTQNPIWQGDDSLFLINSAKELQLDDNGPGSAFLTCQNSISYQAKWEFNLRLEFNPSSSNYAKVYLISDQKDVKGAVNGYFVRIGGSSHDKLSFYRQSAHSTQLLVESPAGYLNNSTVYLRVLVERDSNYTWTMSADTGTFQNNLSLLGQAVDSMYKASSYFGLFCKYTSTRSKLFFFDEFFVSGFPYQDRQKPQLDSIIQVYKNEIQLIFNEGITKISAEDTLNYFLQELNRKPLSAIQPSNALNQVKLIFEKDFVYNSEYVLILNGIKDSSGNEFIGSYTFKFNGEVPSLQKFKIESPKLISIWFLGKLNEIKAVDNNNYLFNNNLSIDSLAYQYSEKITRIDLFVNDSIPRNENLQLNILNQSDSLGYGFEEEFWFCFRDWERNEVLINEIMIDPSPIVGVFPDQLPESEYLELYNPTPYYVNLEAWKLRLNDKLFELGFYNLGPNEFLVLANDENIALFADSIAKMGIGLAQNSLLNSSAQLQLEDEKGLLINALVYDESWFGNSAKEDGGWSLERKDISIGCNGELNWGACENAFGGSPGFENSIIQNVRDSTVSSLNFMIVQGDSVLEIHWAKELGNIDGIDTSDFEIHPKIENYSLSLLDDKTMKIKFLQKLEPHITYILNWKNSPQDCFEIPLPQDSIVFAIPEIPEAYEILVNELMFNPRPGSSDFVELYNNSDKIFDLSKMRIGNWNPIMENIENVANISAGQRLFYPKTYLLISEDIQSVMDNYKTPGRSVFLEVDHLPTMPDDEGSICIINSRYEVLDYFEYSDIMHNSFLQDVEAVSLERLSFDTPTSPWHSASSLLGFASPGYENSQAKGNNLAHEIQIQPKLFSPNLDGRNDFLNIAISEQYSQFVVDISIWNSEGKRVKVLGDRVLLSGNSNFIWQGDDDANQSLKQGIYIVLIEGLHQNGEELFFKGICVLNR